MQSISFIFQGQLLIPGYIFIAIGVILLACGIFVAISIRKELASANGTTLNNVRDWSLIMGRGGGYKTGGGARELLPLRKGGGGRKKF